MLAAVKLHAVLKIGFDQAVERLVGVLQEILLVKPAQGLLGLSRVGVLLEQSLPFLPCLGKLAGAVGFETFLIGDFLLFPTGLFLVQGFERVGRSGKSVPQLLGRAL